MFTWKNYWLLPLFDQEQEHDELLGLLGEDEATLICATSVEQDMIEIDALDEQMRRVLIEDGCRWVYSSISSTCEEFSLLLRTMEDLIEREKTTELEGLSKYAERHPDARRDAFWQDHHPYWWDQIIAAHFRASFLMGLMAVVESHVQYIFENVRAILRTSEFPKKKKGTIYARARRFLRKHGQFEKPS